MKTVYNKTKIVATIGPACVSKPIMTKLIRNGVDICRINFSHGTHADHLIAIQTVREINDEFGIHIGILADLQGPKIRLGEVENGEITLKTGDKVGVTGEPMVSTTKMLSISYPRLNKEVSVDDTILLDDGNLKLQIISKGVKNEVIAEVIHGGKLTAKKGANFPDTKISLPSLSEKDINDLMFALEHDVEWVALSFVRETQDIIKLKGLIEAKGKTARVIAKIEKPEAIENIDGIIAASDAIMVARGDLGVEMAMEKVPLIQKTLVAKARIATKPVIIATQMMESMITNPRPTRAEANDVANSVIDGADAVMLSAETSIGEYPVETINAMQRIISNVESEGYRYGRVHTPSKESKTFLADSICYSACVLAEQVDAKAIIGMTRSGYTAFTISSHRPNADIFIFTNFRPLLNALSLVWGVRGIYYNSFESTDQTIKDCKDILKEKKLVSKGDFIINTASMPIHEKARTNMIKVTVVD
jgi:pyruvate kinase